MGPWMLKHISSGSSWEHQHPLSCWKPEHFTFLWGAVPVAVSWLACSAAVTLFTRGCGSPASNETVLPIAYFHQQFAAPGTAFAMRLALPCHRGHLQEWQSCAGLSVTLIACTPFVWHSSVLIVPWVTFTFPPKIQKLVLFSLWDC